MARSQSRCLCGVAVAVVVLGSAMGLASCDSAKPNVVLYGDSLSAESVSYFRWAGNASGKAVITTRVVASAVCDWFAQMRADAARLRPEAVVLEFTGDTITPCMNGYNPKLDLPAVVDRYRRDLLQAMHIFGDSTHFFIELIPPNGPNGPQWAVEEGAALNAMYRSLASPGVTVENAAAGVENPDGSWARALPCWRIEPVCGTAGPGKNVVRGADEFHFCPGEIHSDFSCSVYASGAFRFGVGMEAPVGRALGF